MISFPSTTNEAHVMYNNGKYSSYNSAFDIDRIKALNLNTTPILVKEQLKEININASNYQSFYPTHQIRSQDISPDSSPESASFDRIYYEYPYELPSEVIALMKDYEWIYKYQANSIAAQGEKQGDSLTVAIASTAVVPSMFNPMYGVNALGILRNTPLLNDTENNGSYQYDHNIDDCSIRTLCALSKDPNSPLGQARYKYADFMYCKDLGKISNNYLITLRKFAHPIGDHIFEGSTPQKIKQGSTANFEIEGDVGRLVTWFGTEDNKIEDIAKYSYHASWKELTSQIQQEPSKADSPNTGIIGMLQNSFSSQYNGHVNAGNFGNHSLFTWLGSQVTEKVFQGIGANNELLSNYDNNKIYTPKNTIQSNHIYEGNLIFNQEFTLKFSYELRAYENINPRSALLDLLGNVFEVTYRRGKFWGGDRKIIGPAQDSSMFDKVSKFIDGAFDQIPGFLESFKNGGLNISKILGKITNLGGSFVNSVVEGVKNFAGDKDKRDAQMNEMVNFLGNLWQGTGGLGAIKGMIKNGLGRPQLYAWHSLVSGDDVGLWHVTVGNPRAPILAMGNLILTNAEVIHSGPLGVDDFPTQLSVIVTLKHAKPRDITDIGRMYTSGTNAIYQHFAGHKIKDFFCPDNAQGPTQQRGEHMTKDEKGNELLTYDYDHMNEEQKNKAVRLAVNNDISSAQKYSSDFNISRPNPYLTNDMEISLMRKNTYSDTMFYMMMQEVA